VGFAGLKDRNALTTQSFTVPRGKRAAAEFVGLAGEGYEVLEAAAHQRKLPRGALEGNHFEIAVRGLRADPALVMQRLSAIAGGGVPNYFGPQRFGRDAGNLEAVMRAAAAQGARRGRAPDQGFMLSAARSLVFNATLAERVRQGSWNRLAPGDVANLDGRGSVFAVDTLDTELERRGAQMELHPTAALPGAGEPLARGAALQLEQSVAAQFPEAMAVIQSGRMNAERRALRLRVRDLSWEHQAEALRLCFALSAGSFATAVLREIIGDVAEE
jgi:tRNA pseudouridine13 synthase